MFMHVYAISTQSLRIPTNESKPCVNSTVFEVYACLRRAYAWFMQSLRISTNERLRKTCVNYAILLRLRGFTHGLCMVYAQRLMDQFFLFTNSLC